MNAWQHTARQLQRSRQGMGTSSPSQLLLEEDTWTNLRKRAKGYRADTARLELRAPFCCHGTDRSDTAQPVLFL